MRIEDISVENCKSLRDSELHNLAQRANQVFEGTAKWADVMAKRLVGVNAPIPRDTLLEAYTILRKEIETRGLEVTPGLLDHKIVSRRLRGIDVQELPPILVKSCVVSLSGPFVYSPKDAGPLTVRVDAGEFGDDAFSFDLEKRMAKELGERTGRGVEVRRDAEGLAAPVMPLYDLVLLPRPATEDVTDIDDLSKRLSDRADAAASAQPRHREEGPEVSLRPPTRFHVSEQRPVEDFDEVERVDDKLGKGAHVVWGQLGGKSKVQSIMFDAATWTPADALKLLDEQSYQSTLEEAAPVAKAAASAFVKNAEERIVGGIVYQTTDAGHPDAQGDFVDDIDEIWKALCDWAIRSDGHMKIMHEGEAIDAVVVENFLAETDVRKSGELVPAGSWYLAVYIPEEEETIWKAITSGELTGFSMAGCAKTEEIDV